MTEVTLLLQREALFTETEAPISRSLVPVSLILCLDVWENLCARLALDAVVAEPGLLRYFGERRLQAMNVHGPIAHVADNDHLLMSVLIAELATLAIGALPRKLPHKVWIQGGLMALAMVNLCAPAALKHKSPL